MNRIYEESIRIIESMIVKEGILNGIISYYTVETGMVDVIKTSTSRFEDWSLLRPTDSWVLFLVVINISTIPSIKNKGFNKQERFLWIQI